MHSSTDAREDESKWMQVCAQGESEWESGLVSEKMYGERACARMCVRLCVFSLGCSVLRMTPLLRITNISISET